MWYYFIFKFIISTNFNVFVDRIIGTPEHGKDVVDSINTCDKRYVLGKCV